MNPKEKSLNMQQFLKLYSRFIKETTTGQRTGQGGKKVSVNTIDNYIFSRKIFIEFVNVKQFDFKLHLVNKSRGPELDRIKKYWRKFFHAFTDFLYYEKDFYDNYVHLVVKCIRAFFNYLSKDLHLAVGEFHRDFKVPQEEISIVVLTPEQLNYLINSQELEERLDKILLKVKDLFVFGCTVALRVSDLMSLTKKNIYRHGNSVYLRVNSKKTQTDTSIKLPDFAIKILERQKVKGMALLPRYTRAYFNLKLKELGRALEYNEPIIKYRNKRGEKKVLYKNKEKKTHFTLADHLTTHTMRRTAITTMLRLNMPEYLVRKISGHAAGSKEFFRYVKFAQSYIDEHTDLIFQKIAAPLAN